MNDSTSSLTAERDAALTAQKVAEQERDEARLARDKLHQNNKQLQARLDQLKGLL